MTKSTPHAGELAEERVVPLLGARLLDVDAPLVLVPVAEVDLVGDVGGPVGRALDGRVPLDGQARDAADDVDAELQALAVDVVGQRLEAAPAGR